MKNPKEVAGALREMAARHLGTAGEVAAGLYALAASIDKPVRNCKDWKGDAAGTSAKRARARRRYRLGPCESCDRPGCDRHHRDGNPGNNAPGNIAILCRRCHMEVDGRLAVFVTFRGQGCIKPLSPCTTCGRLYKPLRKGLCGRCNDRLRYPRKKKIAPPEIDPVTGDKAHSRTMDITKVNTCTCDVCGDQIAGLRWIGEPCVASAPGMRPCAGRYRLDPEPARHIHTRDCYDDAGPGRGGVSIICGLTTSDPEPDEPVRLKDGTELGVTRDRLAMEAALMTMLEEDPDHDEAIEAADVASGHRGRAR